MAGVAVPLAASLSANDFAWMILNSGESSRCFEGNLMLDGWSTSNPRQMLAQPRCYQTLCTSAGLQIIVGSSTSALLVCAIQYAKTFALYCTVGRVRHALATDLARFAVVDCPAEGGEVALNGYTGAFSASI